MEPVLVLNAGSSSLKYQVLELVRDGATVHVKGHVERVDDTGFGPALSRMTDELHEAGIHPDQLAAVGHRVVHGGPDLTTPVVVDDGVLAGIEAASRFAPLHNPPAVAGIRAAREEFPALAHVAVFDTGFFGGSSGLPAAAATYPIDAGVAAAHQIRRYGAHGTSYAYVSAEAARQAGRPLESLAQIVLHLGNGASAAALRGGRPLDTSMGLTPLEGLVMGTRGGDLDPGLLVHLLRSGLALDELDDLLQHRSGLEGMTGMSDLRDVEAARDAGDEGALLALEVYCRRIRKYVGGYLALLGGADQVVLTGGVGEHDTRVREHALGGLAALGIELDPARNAAVVGGAGVISTDASPVTVLVVPTNEELQIAREAIALLVD